VRVAARFAQSGLGAETTAAVAKHSFLWGQPSRPLTAVEGAS